MAYRQQVEKRAVGASMPKRIIFYRGRSNDEVVFMTDDKDKLIQMVSPKDNSSRSLIKVKVNLLCISELLIKC